MDFEEQCYLADPYLVDFLGTVRDVEPAGEGLWAVYLDKTYFYPDSGGQPDDRGTLGGRRVVGVSETDKGVRHIVDGTLEVGASVTGHVDWRRRFDHMQQHSGQHLLSRVALEKLGLKTVSFHLGEEICTVDLEGRAPSEEALDAVEALVNDLVFKDIPIGARIIDAREFKGIVEGSVRAGSSLLRSRLPEGVERVRIVEIEGIDGSTCCGTHCRSTGEIGLVKILGREKVKGNTRVEFICGGRVVKDYAAKHRLLASIASDFSTDWRQLGAVVGKITVENRELRKKNDELGRELAGFRAVELSKPTRSAGGFDIIKRVFADGETGALRDTASQIRAAGKKIVLFGLAAAPPALIFSCSVDVPLNMGELMKGAAASIGGKGGGGRDFAQGGGGDASRIGQALDEVERRIIETLESIQ
jgi:alanyl-tRNA synthetase